MTRRANERIAARFAQQYKVEMRQAVRFRLSASVAVVPRWAGILESL